MKPLEEQFLGSIRLEEIDKSNFYACDNILVSSKFHSIYVFVIFDPTRLVVRPLACFYAFCLKRD